MSDGNFNRNLLPSHSFQSGVRTGRAEQIREAKSEFRRYLED